MFWGKLLGKKAWNIASIWIEITAIYRVFDKLFGKAETIITACVENTIIYSVLEQVVCQEGLNQRYYMGRKHCNL